MRGKAGDGVVLTLLSEPEEAESKLPSLVACSPARSSSDTTDASLATASIASEPSGRRTR